MANYKAYPEYKDSGVEWLGLVPKSWTICRLKNLATIKNGQDYKSVQTDDGYPVMGSGGQFTFASKFMYDKPSVLLGRKGTIDKPLYINEPFWTVDTMYYTELNEGFEAKYLYYLALTIQFSRYSTNTALPSMTQEHLSNYKFSVPKAESERKKITEFLDHETAKIDNLIEKQQQLIELLKEKRQAVISHAVTKGLNPDVPMKDSGVEWLGEVPEHWEVKKLKHVAHIIDCKNRTPEYFDDGEYLVVRTTNVKKQSLVLDDALYTNERDFKIWTERGVPPVGSILFTREAPAGEICIVPAFTKLCMGQRMMNFICHQSNYTNFLFDYLTSDCLKRYIESEAAGSTVSHLRVEQVYNIPIVIPPNSEQKNIDEMVGVMKAQYSRLIDDAECSLVLLQERRNALISAAVTGKIDVRDWVAPDTKDIEEPEETTA
ncbi:restriction endonuclease subunit S [Edwardsiella hoshinae]|uniref:EcoKI restriction-modification system protein HsdS n=1 Tax=Edwardsiella hoshinae TaxID=93378 RepID=A0A376D8C4_9GAMM|nr:restriction endonuclease subunit S [Edwardsiella hoshinae]QPR28318.1 restriction endonuclease subunit S [Edwardsiella hoshinae]STC83903.1 EcoKI restriction-modification system protein HsdS [Edwardsiella hoshinae]